MFGSKKKEESKKNADMATVEVSIIEKPDGMTYTEFVSQELNIRLSELRKKQKKITESIHGALEEMKLKGSKETNLVEIVANLREQETNVQKDIDRTSSKYAVDLGLSLLANDLDIADNYNMGVDLINAAAVKVNEIIEMLPKIEKCFGSEYYAPTAYSMLKRYMESISMTLNVEFSKMNKYDKASLLQEFNKRMTAQEEVKKLKQMAKDKYSVN